MHRALVPGRKRCLGVQVLVDQTTYGPLCNLLFMSFATVVLEGKSFSFLRSKILSLIHI